MMTAPAIRDQGWGTLDAQCPTPVAPYALGSLAFRASHSPSEAHAGAVLNQGAVPILAPFIQQAFSALCFAHTSTTHRSGSHSTHSPATRLVPPVALDYPLPVTTLKVYRV